MQNEAAMTASKSHEFMPAERTDITCDKEVDKILNRAFDHVFPVLQYIIVTCKLQFQYYFFTKFKEELTKTMGTRLLSSGSVDWKDLAKPDASTVQRIAELEGQIDSLEATLSTVRHMVANTF